MNGRHGVHRRSELAVSSRVDVGGALRPQHHVQPALTHLGEQGSGAGDMIGRHGPRLQHRIGARGGHVALYCADPQGARFRAGVERHREGGGCQADEHDERDKG